MATALQAQLAQIASRSNDPLNLKAQREGYSKSLLYEPEVAAAQDLDTLYDVCAEGYHELCEIDGRFTSFGRTVFNEQSKRENRLQMTSSQNEELDVVLESFMGLLAGRLLLKPAIKSLEWLIRQFRVHQYNTAYLLCIFIPYHSQPIFTTLLSILPRKLPTAFQFLTSCVERLRGPSRQELVYAATRNPEFFRLWNEHVLSQCQREFDFHEMTAYWAGAMTEAILGRVEQASRGNEASQRQKEETLLLEILPVLNDGFQLVHSLELRIGCQMIVTVLASKLNLADSVIETMMEAVVSGGVHQTRDADLICLAILAQKHSAIKIPRTVFKTLRSFDNLAGDLELLKREYEISYLVNAIIKAMLRSLKKNKNSFQPTFVVYAIERGFISLDLSAQIVADLLSMASQNEKAVQLVTQTVSELVKTSNGLKALSTAIQVHQTDPTLFDDRLRALLAGVELDTAMDSDAVPPEDTTMALEPVEGKAKFRHLQAQLPGLSNSPGSFLGAGKDFFDSYYRAFQASMDSPLFVSEFVSSSSLGRHAIFSEPKFLSFFIRIWGVRNPSNDRALAIRCVRDSVRDIGAIGYLEAQCLLPYILAAIFDDDVQVRIAGIDLLVSLHEAHEIGASKDAKKAEPPFHGRDLCDDEVTTNERRLLSAQSTQSLMDVLMLYLEEYRLDSSFLAQLFSQLLSSKPARKNGAQAGKELKSAQKDSVFSFFADQILHAPLETIKLQLLTLFKQAGVNTRQIKGDQLINLVRAYYDKDDRALEQSARDEELVPSDLASAALGLISPNDSIGLKAMLEFVKAGSTRRQIMHGATLRHLVNLWPEMESDWQSSFALALLEEAVCDRSEDTKPLDDPGSLDTLQQLRLRADVLEKLLDALPPTSTTSSDQTSPSSKRRKVHPQQNGLDSQRPVEGLSQYVSRVTITLEVIESSKDGSDSKLMEPLFVILADLHRVKDANQNMDYAQCLLLSILTAVIEKMKKENQAVKRPTIRADLVVDYFRNATNVQLQQASLLLLSALASFVPAQVIHSIMPIFTFMGSTILRLSDEYSAHVIDKTIQSIIPPLIVSLKKDKSGPLAGASELLLSFVAAFDHIPIQRRKSLFIVLVDKLGPEQFLHPLIMMLVDKHYQNQKVQWFAQNLTAHYHPIVQLKTIEGCLTILLDSLKLKPNISRHVLSNDQNRDPKETVLTLARLPTALLRNPELLSRITRLVRKGPEEAEPFRQSFATILRSILRLQEHSLTDAHFLPVQADLLDASLGVLPLNEALKALEHQLMNGEDKTRQEILRSLQSQISTQPANDARLREACLGFLPLLQEILSSTDNTSLRSACISCADCIAETFGKSNPNSLAKIATDIAGESGLASTDKELQIRSLICLSTLVEVLEDDFIPNIPKVVPICLSLLENMMQNRMVDEKTSQAGYTFFSSLLLYLPYVVTGEYLDRLLLVSFQCSSSKITDFATQARDECLTLVPQHVGPHECFASLSRTWEQAKVANSESTQLYLSLLSATVGRLTKVDAIRHSSIVMKLCLKILDIRRLWVHSNDHAQLPVWEIEKAVNDVLMSIIYKLNDARFRPIFVQLLEWSRDNSLQGEDERYARASSFYSFVGHFFETLKSVVTAYSALFANDAAELLDKCSPNDSSFSLWNRIISTLTAAFENDQDGFWQSPTRFSSILPALTGQLERITTETQSVAIIPCITHLARAADSPDNLKALSSAILTQMRSPSPWVRLNAVRCEQSLTKGLGEEWLSLLPEMLPFISEVMEDDDEDVEAEVRAWVRLVEETLGEPLDAMLQ